MDRSRKAVMLIGLAVLCSVPFYIINRVTPQIGDWLIRQPWYSTYVDFVALAVFFVALTEQFLEELRQIQQFVLLYPPLGDKGPNRVATVLSKQTLAQQALAESLGLEQLCSTQRG